MKRWSDSEIESLFRHYYFNKEQLELLSEPTITSQLRLDKGSFGNNEQSKAEMMAIRKVQAEIDIRMAEACLKIMTKDEKEFINLRYFEEMDIKIIEGCMRIPARTLYRIRDSIIVKSRELLTISAA
jgi:DNA-directed RNA polymerase specialized sigma subunit